jgi:hypothetical protein
MAIIMEKYISISDAARQLGVTRQRASVLAADRRIAGRIIAGRRVLLADSVAAFSLLPRQPGRPKKQKTIGQ